MKKLLYFIFLYSFSVIFSLNTFASFSDIPTRGIEREAVQTISSIGAVKSVDYFRPNDPITMGELAKILSISANAFNKDKMLDLDIEEYIKYMFENGIYEDLYSSDRYMTRLKGLNYIIKNFDIDTTYIASEVVLDDVPANAWYKNMLSKALELNLIDVSDGFQPNKLLSRKDAVVAVYKLYYDLYLQDLRDQENQPTITYVIENQVELTNIQKVKNIINSNFLYSENINEDKMQLAAIKAIVKSLDDPYSEYFSANENKSFMDSLEEDLTGIGAYVEQKDGDILIVAPIDGSPAKKVGLKPKDIILFVDGKSTDGKSLNEVVTWIRGKEDTTVKVTILRGDQKMNFDIVRKKIDMHIVDSKWYDNGLLYISIKDFTDDAPINFLKIVDDNAYKAKGVILDLRNNPGGFLDSAIDIASNWMDNDQLIAQINDKNKSKSYYTSFRNGKLKDKKTVILINNGSASASEIVAGALKDYNKAFLIGEKSFGKGTAQSVIPFNDGSSLKLTIAEWLTPNGNAINHIGIEPDLNVIDNLDTQEDEQLQKAINYFR